MSTCKRSEIALEDNNRGRKSPCFKSCIPDGSAAGCSYPFVSARYSRQPHNTHCLRRKILRLRLLSSCCKKHAQGVRYQVVWLIYVMAESPGPGPARRWVCSLPVERDKWRQA